MPGTRTQVGQRISEAKKGKPAVSRDPDVATLQQSVSEIGHSRKVLLEAMDRQTRFERGESERRGIRHECVPANHGVARLCYRDQRDEDLAHPDNRCKWCDAPAPGDSKLCRRHQAKKYATVELTCEQCGEAITRYGSVHRWRAERGDEHTFCGDRCKMLWLKDNHPRFGSPYPPFDAKTQQERQRRLQEDLRADAVVRGLPLGVPDVATATHTSPSVIRAHSPELGGQVFEKEGAKWLGLPPDAPQRYLRARARAGGDHYLEPTFAEKQQKRRLRALLNAGLSEGDAYAVIRGRAEARKKLLAHHRRGRPRSTDLHRAWHQLFKQFRDEFEAEGHKIVPWHIALAVAEYDFGSNPSRWPRYRCSPDDPESLHPDEARKAALRVWKAVKPLLTAAY